VHPVESLRRLGGLADRPTLLQLTSRRRLRTAVSRGDVLRLGPNRYALPTASDGVRAAGRVAGVASHRSAAAAHGWELAHQPARPEVIVPRGRKLDPARRAGIHVRWRRPLTEAEVYRGVVTEAHRTVIDCARDLPFEEALSIADSALRHRHVDRDHLLELALRLPSSGRRTALRVVEAADGRAANPFESVLRALALRVEGLDLEPQVLIEDRGFRGRPDLVDRRRRLVLEADSFAWHGSRRALERDCARYNALVIRGWTVLRFSWEHVMLQPDYVRAVLRAVVHGPGGRTPLAPELLWAG
jgi:very-short-patch-repair endonuclease